jgi:predicted small secreted protein
MRVMIRLAVAAAILSAGLGLGACGNTWSGVKQDTAKNVSATGTAVEKAGQDIKDTVQ